MLVFSAESHGQWAGKQITIYRLLSTLNSNKMGGEGNVPGTKRECSGETVRL